MRSNETCQLRGHCSCWSVLNWNLSHVLVFSLPRTPFPSALVLLCSDGNNKSQEDAGQGKVHLLSHSAGGARGPCDGLADLIVPRLRPLGAQPSAGAGGSAPFTRKPPFLSWPREAWCMGPVVYSGVQVRVAPDLSCLCRYFICTISFSPRGYPVMCPVVITPIL